MPRNWSGAVCHVRWIMMLGALCTVLSTPRTDAEPPPAPSTVAKAAIEPVAPVVPPEVIAALQGGEYETARSALIALGNKATDRDDGTYYAYLQAIAERLSGQRDAARETLRKGLRPARPAAGPRSSDSSWRASSWPPVTGPRPRS